MSYIELDTSKAPRFGPVVALKNFALTVTRFALAQTDDGRYRFDFAVEVPDRDTGAPREIHWAMYYPASRGDAMIVGDMNLTIYNLLIHELAEAWLVNGERPEDPHGPILPTSAFAYHSQRSVT